MIGIMLRIEEASADAGFWAWLETKDGGSFVEVKDLGDGCYAGARHLLFHATLVIGIVGNRFTYEDRYCYANIAMAIAAMHAWDGRGDPIGWHRHPKSGRRRPDGDASREYIDP